MPSSSGPRRTRTSSTRSRRQARHGRQGRRVLDAATPQRCPGVARRDDGRVPRARPARARRPGDGPSGAAGHRSEAGDRRPHLRSALRPLLLGHEPRPSAKSPRPRRRPSSSTRPTSSAFWQTWSARWKSRASSCRELARALLQGDPGRLEQLLREAAGRRASIEIQHGFQEGRFSHAMAEALGLGDLGGEIDRLRRDLAGARPRRRHGASTSSWPPPA